MTDSDFFLHDIEDLEFVEQSRHLILANRDSTCPLAFSLSRENSGALSRHGNSVPNRDAAQTDISINKKIAKIVIERAKKEFSTLLPLQVSRPRSVPRDIKVVQYIKRENSDVMSHLNYRAILLQTPQH